MYFSINSAYRQQNNGKKAYQTERPKKRGIPHEREAYGHQGKSIRDSDEDASVASATQSITKFPVDPYWFLGIIKSVTQR